MFNRKPVPPHCLQHVHNHQIILKLFRNNLRLFLLYSLNVMWFEFKKLNVLLTEPSNKEIYLYMYASIVKPTRTPTVNMC